MRSITVTSNSSRCRYVLADAVQLGPVAAHGVRRRLVRRALRPGARRQHAPVRHLPVGPVDRLRPGVDRGGRRRVRHGRRDLRVPAKGSLRAGPYRRPDGPPELLLRGGHAHRRPRPAVALVRAGLEPPRALGDVRGVVVRHALRHDPPARIPAGALRAVRIRPGRGGLAAMERRLRRGGRDAVRVHAHARRALHGRHRRGVRHHRLDLPRARRRRPSRSCWRSPPSRCRPCTRARSAPCTC